MPPPLVTQIPLSVVYAAGQVIKASELRSSVTDAVGFLTARPVFAGQNTAGTTYGSGADDTMVMNAEIIDNWSGHNTASSTTQYFCQFPGWYLCKSVIAWNYSSATNNLFTSGFQGTTNLSAFGPVRGARQLRVTASGIPTTQCVDLIKQTATVANVGEADYIQPTVYQGTGGNLSLETTATSYPYVTIRWVAYNAQLVSGALSVPVNASWPVPPSYVTSSFVNTNVTDTIAFLFYPPICKAYYTAGTTTLPSNTFPAGAVIDLTTVTVDNFSGFTTGTSALYTAPVAGNYFCYGQFNLVATAAQFNTAAGFRVNGGTTMWGDSMVRTSNGSDGSGAQVQKRLRLNAGDTVQFMGQQSSGSAIEYATAAADQTRMIVVWEGA